MFRPAPSTTSTSTCAAVLFFLISVSQASSEQEHDRTQESSNVDDRTEHELYAHPFLRSVMAGVASVMCSYSTPVYLVNHYLGLMNGLDLVNDTFACENDRTINQILKGENGFRGYVMSDWSAQHSTMSAVAGLDVREANYV